MRSVMWMVAVAAFACGSDSSSPPDAAPPDAEAAAFDAAPMIDAPPNLTPEEACDVKYGSLAGYELCSANASACTFLNDTSGRTCIDVCEQLGGVCINSHSGVCTTKNPTLESCQVAGGAQVCICSLL